ncbi:MAG: hypothetical protein WC308_00665 [archaeon]|jgi:hypothetical protein
MPTHAYLTDVAYSGDKQQIFAEFSSESGKEVERFAFFPFISFSSALSENQIEELLLSLGIKKFRISSKSDLKKIESSDFSELKRISTALAVSFGQKPLLLEPERQFLLSKGWKFFDEFDLSGEIPEKIENFFPDIGFFLTKEVPFSEAMRLSESETLALLKRAAISRALSIKMENIPSSPKDIAESFLENFYFKTGQQFSFRERGEFFVAREFAPLGYYGDVSEIDFSPVWARLFTKNFFNIGVETKNCDCCQPVTIDDSNLYPDSLIEVSFLEDGFFFESSSKSFSASFHESKPLKLTREQKKKEFFLKAPPIGPFFKGQKELVPVSDAKRLLSDEKVSLGKNHSLSWFCKKNESSFSKELSSVLSEISLLGRNISKGSDSLFVKGDSVYWFSLSQMGVIESILAEVPFQLMNLNSKFFSHETAASISAIQESTVSKFREFSEKRGYRVLYADQKGAFVKGFSSLSLVKGFSEELSLPQPVVKDFSSGKRLSGRQSIWA